MNPITARENFNLLHQSFAAGFETLLWCELQQADPLQSLSRLAPELRAQVNLIFTECSADFNKLIDSFPQVETAASDLLPCLVRVLSQSVDAVNLAAAAQQELAYGIAYELRAWLNVCETRLNYDEFEPPKNLTDLDQMITAELLKVTQSTKHKDRQNSLAACENIAGALVSLTNPVELMRNSGLFETFASFEEAFEVYDTIDGVLLDYYRTQQFVYGIRAAVSELEKRFPESPEIRIADVGSGAFGILGLAALAASDKVFVEFVERNPQATILLGSLIEKLGLQDRVKITTCDAFTWQAETNFHAIISETMAAGLMLEPFPRLAQNIRNYLLPEGLFLPEKIKLQLLVENNTPGECNYQIDAQPAMFLSILKTDRAFCFNEELPTAYFDPKTFSGERITFKVSTSNLTAGSYQLWVGTNVHIFDSHQLKPNETQITTQQILKAPNGKPYRLNLPPEKLGTTLEISYLLGRKEIGLEVKTLA